MGFIEEINQQSEALLNLICEYRADSSNAQRLIDLIKERNISEFIFTGMGSSCFVGYTACTLLSKKGIKSMVYETKDFSCAGINTIGPESMIFLISQSGTCKEIMDFCRDHLQDGHNTAIITNNPDKPLYQHGEVKFLLHAGCELTTANKTYTNTIAALLYICNIILESKGLKPYDFYSLASECASIISKLVIANSNAMTNFFEDAIYICHIGGGASYCTASQASLITEEAGKMYSACYSPAGFLHGPVELIDKRFNGVAYDFSDDHREEIDRVIDNILAYGGKICVITNRNINTCGDRLLCAKLPIDNEFYAPLAEIVPVELFINNIGLKRGFAPGILSRVRK